MNRQEKAQVVDVLQNDFAKNQGAFLVNFKGLTVDKMQVLRKNLRQQNGVLKVAKARLMSRAVDAIPAGAELKPLFKDQVGLVFAQTEAPAIAKMLYEFSKKNEHFKLIAGFMDQEVFGTHAIVRIAQLPSRLELLGQLCGMLNAPIVALACVLKAIAEKKSAGTEMSEPAADSQIADTPAQEAE